MNPLSWAILLLICGLLLVVLEVFVPSGGVLGFLSIAALMTAIGMAFYQSGLQTGLIFVGVIAVAVPSLLAFAFRWWPHTPMGKRLLLGVPDPSQLLPDSAMRRTLKELVGHVGTAKSLMLPSGSVEIDGMLLDATSEGLPIEAGQRVRVVEVRANRVVVRPVDKDTSIQDRDDILSQPLESLGLDPFDEPLG